MTLATAPYVSFDRIADRYEASRYIPPSVLHAAAALISADFLHGSGGSLLDVGVGTGRFARALREVGVPTVGLDVSANMLRQAADKAPCTPLVCGDARHLPFGHAAFGGALIVHVMHLVEDWRSVLRDIRRVLAPGGRLYLGSESGRQYPCRGIYFQAAA